MIQIHIVKINSSKYGYSSDFSLFPLIFAPFLNKSPFFSNQTITHIFVKWKIYTPGLNLPDLLGWGRFGILYPPASLCSSRPSRLSSNPSRSPDFVLPDLRTFSSLFSEVEVVFRTDRRWAPAWPSPPAYKYNMSSYTWTCFSSTLQYVTSTVYACKEA